MLCRIAQEIAAPQQIVAGREAVLAGALTHSRRDDYVATSQNAVLAALLRGDQPSSLLAQLFSQDAGPNAPPQATPGQLALIKAMGASRDLLGSGRVALAFCGADPAALSFQKEALALAAKHKAPVVCLIETTLSSLDAENQASKRKTKRAEPQFPVIVVDGADVVAIFRVVQEAVRRARHGQGPSLVECVMPDQGTADPLVFIEQYLRRKNLWSDEWQRGIADEFAAQLDRALPFMPTQQPGK
ncbi:MAG TPA: thiamine pyrophosphate-dependent enzyme [Candidatus Angelobacter sp.]|nr:thiamine pyrophosphate-dependent enzyme [Candidatus Angelobacter sp.]